MNERVSITERILEILQEPQERKNSLEKESKLLPLLEELERIHRTQSLSLESNSPDLSHQKDTSSSHFDYLKACNSIVNCILNRGEEKAEENLSFLLYFLSSPF